MRLENDIVPLFEACIDGTLEKQSLTWKQQSAVCVVLIASQGYPGAYLRKAKQFLVAVTIS